MGSEIVEIIAPRSSITPIPNMIKGMDSGRSGNHKP